MELNLSTHTPFEKGLAGIAIIIVIDALAERRLTRYLHCHPFPGNGLPINAHKKTSDVSEVFYVRATGLADADAMSFSQRFEATSKTLVNGLELELIVAAIQLAEHHRSLDGGVFTEVVAC